MTSHRIATWYLIVVAAVLVLFGSGDVVGGVTVDPGITLEHVSCPANDRGLPGSVYRVVTLP